MQLYHHEFLEAIHQLFVSRSPQSHPIASMLPSPISSIHLLNPASSFLLSSVKLCDESHLFNVSWSTVTCNHKGELTIAKPIISAREPPCTIGKVCLRSPPKTTAFPPKGNLLYRDYGIKTIS
jgi:hypothetical protein